MKLKKNIRGQSIAVDKLVIWIIVILVVASIAIFLFKADILNWIRNLPSYKVSEGGSAGVAGCLFIRRVKWHNRRFGNSCIRGRNEK